MIKLKVDNYNNKDTFMQGQSGSKKNRQDYIFFRWPIRVFHMTYNLHCKSSSGQDRYSDCQYLI